MDNKKLKSSWAAAFTVASVWFGTHVGAGFATGNQVVNYFVQYGWTAAIFPLLAMGILAVVMYIMMKFAKLSGFDNYKDTYRALYPKPWMEVFFEIFYIIIILAAVASCVDGAGGIVKSLVDLPDIICTYSCGTEDEPCSTIGKPGKRSDTSSRMSKRSCGFVPGLNL